MAVKYIVVELQFLIDLIMQLNNLNVVSAFLISNYVYVYDVYAVWWETINQESINQLNFSQRIFFFYFLLQLSCVRVGVCVCHNVVW